jgi:hypothetical protein
MSKKSEKDIHVKVKSVCPSGARIENNRVLPGNTSPLHRVILPAGRTDTDCVPGDWYPANYQWSCDDWCSYSKFEVRQKSHPDYPSQGSRFSSCAMDGAGGSCGDAAKKGHTKAIQALRHDDEYFTPLAFNGPGAVPAVVQTNDYKCLCGPTAAAAAAATAAATAAKEALPGHGCFTFIDITHTLNTSSNSACNVRVEHDSHNPNGVLKADFGARSNVTDNTPIIMMLSGEIVADGSTRYCEVDFTKLTKYEEEGGRWGCSIVADTPTSLQVLEENNLRHEGYSCISFSQKSADYKQQVLLGHVGMMDCINSGTNKWVGGGSNTRNYGKSSCLATAMPRTGSNPSMKTWYPYYTVDPFDGVESRAKKADWLAPENWGAKSLPIAIDGSTIRCPMYSGVSPLS